MKKQILYLILGCCIGLAIGFVITAFIVFTNNSKIDTYKTKISELEQELKAQETTRNHNKPINPIITWIDYSKSLYLL